MYHNRFFNLKLVPVEGNVTACRWTRFFALGRKPAAMTSVF
jgi:hypothetical protein